MWLLSVLRSDRKDKKYKATFCMCTKKNECKGSNHKTVHFGQKGYSDYTVHGDDKRKEMYLARHKANENWNDPTTAGALSRWILWGNSRSLTVAIEQFRKRFGV